MRQVATLNQLQSKVYGNKSGGSDLPDILIVLKATTRYGISHEMIKKLSYNDLLAIIIDYQIQELREYLNNKNKQQGNKEVIHLDVKGVTKFLLGGIPQKKGGLT